MKAWLTIGVIAAASVASAQIPELYVHADLTGSFRTETGQPNLFQFYDVLGRPSIVSLSFYTPQQFRVYVAEKLEHLPSDAPGDTFDQYFIEDEGIWRVGKQYLPFGSGQILHESALAARGDTNMILESVPLSIALCDGGEGYERGVTGRIGSMIGLSFAYGRHFGIAATSLDDIRRPEDATGAGRGWQQAFGIDASRRFGKWTVRAEAVTFREGETLLDGNLSVFEAAGTYEPHRGQSTTVAVTEEAPAHQYFYRVGGDYAIVKRVSFEPMIRFRDGAFYDLAAEIRVRF